MVCSSQAQALSGRSLAVVRLSPGFDAAPGVALAAGPAVVCLLLRFFRTSAADISQLRS